MELKGKKILVTGAGGFIGSHLTEELVRRGHSVRALVRYSGSGSWGWLDTSDKEIKDSLEVIAGDIRDPHMMNDVVKGCDVVFHLAALIAIPFSYHAPQSYVETNITGTCNMLQAARNHGVERFVQTSTSETYGTALYVPIDEDHPLQGQSPYSATKIGSDQLALSFQRSFEVPVSVIRPFNTYGPRQSSRAVIPTIITQLAANLPVHLGSLTPTRDLTYVADTARGFIAVAEADAAIGQVVNIGTDFEISIGDLANLISEVMGRGPLDIAQDKERMRPVASEVERLWASNKKAKALTGWEPTLGGLEGLRHNLGLTAEWFQVPSNLARYRAGTYTV